MVVHSLILLVSHFAKFTTSQSSKHKNQFTFQTKVKQTIFHTHKVMESKSCISMQRFGSIARMVSTRLLNFVRSKLAIHQSGKVISKWVFIHKPFLNPFIISCGEKCFYQGKTLKLFTKWVANLQNLVFWVSGFDQTIFLKFSFNNYFYNKNHSFYLARKWLGQVIQPKSLQKHF